MLNSDCAQHMSGGNRMFNSTNTSGKDEFGSITFSYNDKRIAKGLKMIVISNDLNISNVLL